MSRLSGQGFHNVEELVIHKKEKEIKFEPLFYFYRKFTVVFFAVPKSDSLRISICLFYFCCTCKSLVPMCNLLLM